MFVEDLGNNNHMTVTTPARDNAVVQKKMMMMTRVTDLTTDTLLLPTKEEVQQNITAQKELLQHIQTMRTADDDNTREEDSKQSNIDHTVSKCYIVDIDVDVGMHSFVTNTYVVY